MPTNRRRLIILAAIAFLLLIAAVVYHATSHFRKDVLYCRCFILKHFRGRGGVVAV